MNVNACPDCDEEPCVCDVDDHDWQHCSCGHCESLRANRGVPDPERDEGIVYR